MESFGAISSRLHRSSSNRNSSNVDSAAAKWQRDNLPEWLTPYIQNPNWAVRYAQLLNEGGELVLRELIKRLPSVKWRGQPKPYHYMNAACSKANWADTVRQMRQSLRIDELAKDVFKRLEATQKQARAIYAACWRLGTSVVRHAVTAQEIGRDRFKFFCWLTSSKNLSGSKA